MWRQSRLSGTTVSNAMSISTTMNAVSDTPERGAVTTELAGSPDLCERLRDMVLCQCAVVAIRLGDHDIPESQFSLTVSAADVC